MDKDLLEEYYTKAEIFSQPELWKKTYKKFLQESESLKSFLKKVFSKKNLDIILTGAGTSAFIGDVLEGSFQKELKIKTKAIATTDLVTHPEIYLNENKPLLLVSFARSGTARKVQKQLNLQECYVKKFTTLLLPVIMKVN